MAIAKSEIVKIGLRSCFFIHILRKEYPEVNVLQMLGKPSMENNDNLLLEWETSNGKYMRFAEQQIEKEITLSKKHFQKILSNIVNTWGDRMNKLHENLEIPAFYDYGYSEYIGLHMQEQFVYNGPKTNIIQPLIPLELLSFRLNQY